MMTSGAIPKGLDERQILWWPDWHDSYSIDVMSVDQNPAQQDGLCH